VSAAAADWLLSALGNERLYQAVVAVPTLQESVFRGGFQPAPATLDNPAVRRRLHSGLLGRLDRLEALLRQGTGSPWASAGEVLQALDTAWLLRHWRALLRGAAGAPALAVAMALDSRAGVRARGLRLLRRRGLWGSGWRPRQEALPPALRWLVPAAAPVPAAEAPAPAPAVTHEMGVLRDALARHRERLRESDQEQRQARLQWGQREKELRRELRESRAAAEQAAADVEARVAKAVAAFRQHALGVTPECARLAEAVAESERGDLVERAERVLADQRRQNELHGTYSEVRARIRELCAMAQRLGLCMDESVTVLPGVRGVHAAICREVDRLQALLPAEEPPMAELAAQLVARIKEPRPVPEAVSELARLEGLLGIDVIADLLGDEGLRQVRTALLRRRQVVTETVLAGAADATPASVAARAPRELWDVHAALASGSTPAVRVFIDGYNAIRRVPELAAIEENGGLTRSREALCDLCRRRAHLLAHMEIVFDGQGALSAREERDGLMVVFSNGLRDSQNADEYLVARVARARSEGGPVWLVTDDRGLRAQSGSWCDAYIGCLDWYRFVS